MFAHDRSGGKLLVQFILSNNIVQHWFILLIPIFSDVLIISPMPFPIIAPIKMNPENVSGHEMSFLLMT
jgi:hypothetical protein